MREPYTQNYMHLVWATWDRLPLLTGEIKDAIYACIQQECSRLKADVIAIGGIEDHIHLLVRFPMTVAMADLLKQVKGVSSHMVTHKLGYKEGFKWQGAYGAFTYSKADVPRVRAYILNQEQHHRNGTTLPDMEFSE